MISIETSTNGKNRYFGYEFDDQNDEVTYLDKPNQLLILKNNFRSTFALLFC